MNLVVFSTCIYAFLEITITGYIEYTENKNKATGIILYALALFCLIAPNFVV